MIHTISVRERRITVDPPRIVAGGKGADKLKLDLDGEWDGAEVDVVLGTGESVKAAPWTGEPMDLPAELIAEPGWLPISITGELDGALIVTERADRVMRVVDGGEVLHD